MVRRKPVPIISRRKPEASRERAAKSIAAAKSHGGGDHRHAGRGIRQAVARGIESQRLDPLARGRAKFAGETPAELARTQADARRKRCDAEIAVEMLRDPGRQFGEAGARPNLKAKRF